MLAVLAHTYLAEAMAAFLKDLELFEGVWLVQADQTADWVCLSTQHCRRVELILKLVQLRGIIDCEDGIEAIFTREETRVILIKTLLIRKQLIFTVGEPVKEARVANHESLFKL